MKISTSVLDTLVCVLLPVFIVSMALITSLAAVALQDSSIAPTLGIDLVAALFFVLSISMLISIWFGVAALRKSNKTLGDLNG